MDSDIKKATYEAIYWWNRVEGYYHSCFLKLDEIKKDEKVFDFFIQKVFEIFLKEYSIRRNLPAGIDAPKDFLRLLISMGFIDEVKSGNIEIIDETSAHLKKNHGYRGTVSLLSKVAFLINPSSYSLYDSLAKKSLYYTLKSSKKMTWVQLEKYSLFMNGINFFINEIHDEIIIHQNLIERFPGTEANLFFKTNSEAFKLRVLDKYLWIISSERPLDNSGFEKFDSLIK